MDDIGQIIEKIRQRGFFSTIKRFSYVPYDIKIALNVVSAIGKERSCKFAIDDQNRFAYENMIRWVHGDPDFKCLDPETRWPIPGRLNAGIYIAGNTGTGKSWLLEIMAAYSTVDNVQIVVGDTQRCLYWKNLRADTVCDEYTETGSFERFKKSPIIGFQDLGSEPVESMYMGNRVNVMRQILEYRGDQTDKITLITSNLPINHKAFVDRYGDRVSSRLHEMCNYFEIKGKDRRKI
jgi:hypothetical protein